MPSKYLERAFASTYGFELHEVLGKAARPALRSYRTSVRSFIPAFAEGEVVLHRNQFPAQPDDPEYHKFMDRVQRTNYERRWKRAFRGPGFKAHLIAALIFIVPKVAAASDLAIKIPTQETELRYLRSVNHTVDVFEGTSKGWRRNPIRRSSFRTWILTPESAPNWGNTRWPTRRTSTCSGR